MCEAGKRRRCDPLMAYIPALHTMASRYGRGRQIVVYFATDTESVRDELLDARVALHNYTWLIRPTVRRQWPEDAHTRLQVETALLQKRVDGYTEMVDVLVDMLLLAETDVLVGKFSSNLDRLVYALMANARRGSVCLPPFVSLDHP